MADQPKKKFPNIASEFIKHSLQGSGDGRTVQAIDCKRGSIYGCKDFPFDPGIFLEFPTGNFA